MHHLVVLLILLPCATFPVAVAGDGGGGDGCNRRCNGNVVPYPFGFSGDCPILLTCDASISTMPLLPHSTSNAPYAILSFNFTTSTFLAYLPPSCNRSVAEARSSLISAGYGVSSRTGLFLRGACRALAPRYSNCTVPTDLMTRRLRMERCRGAFSNSNDTSWTCVASVQPAPSSDAAANGQGQFLQWEMVIASGCQDAVTAAVYGDTQKQGVPPLQFGVAELGWWLNGTCGTGAGQCAANATCHDVQTPSGVWGHRCACPFGMLGDGFAAGDGCYYVTNVNAAASVLSNIENLNGANFPDWKSKVTTCLAWNDLDMALREEKPAAPEAGQAATPAFEKWEKSNRMALMVMTGTISPGIKGTLPTKNSKGHDYTAKEFLAKVEENFKSSSKTYASTLIMKLVSSQYTGTSGIREHILNMCDMAHRLKEMKMEISDGFLVHFIMTSLPSTFNAFKINYNTNKSVWTISELISYCVEEEERIKTEKMKDVVNMVGNLSLNSTPKNQYEASSSKQGQKGGAKNKNKGNKNFAPKNNNKFKNNHSKGGKMLCSFCNSPKHLQKACPGFKEWLKQQGIPFDPNYKKGGAKPKSG